MSTEMSTITWTFFLILSSVAWFIIGHHIGYSDAKALYSQGVFISREDILRLAAEINDEEEAER